MPQITIEYSRNVETRADVPALLRAVHEAARDTGLFERGFGIRTRAVARDLYLVANQDPDNAFVAVRARIAEGRTPAQREQLADALFATTCAQLAQASATSPLAISIEVQEIADLGARNHNNLHQRLAAR
jgi:5-carboxymethyl-2-hydroxymuconate isomerase